MIAVPTSCAALCLEGAAQLQCRVDEITKAGHGAAFDYGAIEQQIAEVAARWRAGQDGARADDRVSHVLDRRDRAAPHADGRARAPRGGRPHDAGRGAAVLAQWAQVKAAILETTRTKIADASLPPPRRLLEAVPANRACGAPGRHDAT